MLGPHRSVSRAALRPLPHKFNTWESLPDLPGKVYEYRSWERAIRNASPCAQSYSRCVRACRNDQGALCGYQDARGVVRTLEGDVLGRVDTAGAVLSLDGSVLHAVLSLDGSTTALLGPDGSVAGFVVCPAAGPAALAPLGDRFAVGPGGVIVDVASGVAVATSVHLVQEGMAVLGSNAEVIGVIGKDGVVYDCAGMLSSFVQVPHAVMHHVHAAVTSLCCV
jgi:hypothetical protein